MGGQQAGHKVDVNHLLALGQVVIVLDRPTDPSSGSDHNRIVLLIGIIFEVVDDLLVIFLRGESWFHENVGGLGRALSEVDIGDVIWEEGFGNVLAELTGATDTEYSSCSHYAN